MEPIWTQADIDTLKAAMREGVLAVTFGGPPARSKTFQSLDQMRELLKEMVADVRAAAGTRRRFRRVRWNRGFNRGE